MFPTLPPQLNQPYPSLMYGIETKTSPNGDFVSDYINKIKEDNRIAFSFQTPEERFISLSQTWKLNTINTSSVNIITSDPSYLQIISMGKSVLPLITAELQKEPDHWFVALRAITGVNPVREESRGNMEMMTEDWLTWLNNN